jgi:hypothetical protein
MAKKKAPSKTLKDRLNAGYEKMQFNRMKEKAGKARKNGCDCER